MDPREVLKLLRQLDAAGAAVTAAREGLVDLPERVTRSEAELELDGGRGRSSPKGSRWSSPSGSPRKR